VVFKEEVDALTALPEQNQSLMRGQRSSILDFLSADELATQLKIFHMELFEATSELELIIQVYLAHLVLFLKTPVTQMDPIGRRT